MNETDDRSAGARRDTSSVMPKPGTDAGTAQQKLSESASHAAQAVKDEAKSLGSEAQHLAEGQAEKVKDMATSQMDVFADALRAASDQLSKDQSGPAAEMVAHAASGLEQFSRSLHGRSTGQMVETIREFGRTNPIGFLAGSVLAGVALGRFAAASAPAATSSPSAGAGSTTGSRAAATPNSGGSTSPLAQPSPISQHQDRGITS